MEKPPRPFACLIILATTALHIYIGISSPGYDDEILNIQVAEQGMASLTNFANSHDVHPPGMYIINYFLHKLLGDWSLVRAFSGALCGVATSAWALRIWRREGQIAGLLTFCFMALNPNILMWCTGLRWQAYFIPILLWILDPPPPSRTHFWIKPAAGLAALLYLSYAALIIAPPVLLLYYKHAHAKAHRKIMGLSLTMGGFLSLGSWQITLLISTHSKNLSSQVSEVEVSLTNFFVSQLGNQGIFPLSPMGMTGAAASAYLLAVAIRLRPQGTLVCLTQYLTLLATLLITGLGAKARNFLLLAPFQSHIFAGVISKGKTGATARVAAAIAVFTNLVGTINVIRHEDTSRNTWNLPVHEAVHRLRSMSADNFGMTVLVHEPVLAWHLKCLGYRVLSPNLLQSSENGIAVALEGESLIVALSYRGSIPADRYADMMRCVAPIIEQAALVEHIGKDRYAYIKKLVDPEFPEDIYRLYRSYALRDKVELSSWAGRAM